MAMLERVDTRACHWGFAGSSIRDWNSTKPFQPGAWAVAALLARSPLVHSERAGGLRCEAPTLQSGERPHSSKAPDMKTEPPVALVVLFLLAGGAAGCWFGLPARFGWTRQTGRPSDALWKRRYQAG